MEVTPNKAMKRMLDRSLLSLPFLSAALKRRHVGSKSGCSCTFRHLYSIELGFGEPVDWYPEEPDAIEATIQLASTIRRLAAC